MKEARQPLLTSPGDPRNEESMMTENTTTTMNGQPVKAERLLRQVFDDASIPYRIMRAWYEADMDERVLVEALYDVGVKVVKYESNVYVFSPRGAEHDIVVFYSSPDSFWAVDPLDETDVSETYGDEIEAALEIEYERRFIPDGPLHDTLEEAA